MEVGDIIKNKYGNYEVIDSIKEIGFKKEIGITNLGTSLLNTKMINLDHISLKKALIKICDILKIDCNKLEGYINKCIEPEDKEKCKIIG